MANQKSGWEIHTVVLSGRNGGFFVQGINHETNDILNARIGWHVDSLTNDSRYYLADGALISEAAKTLLCKRGWPATAADIREAAEIFG